MRKELRVTSECRCWEEESDSYFMSAGSPWGQPSYGAEGRHREVAGSEREVEGAK